MPILYRRNCELVNTDPQRRCYDGCHFSTEIVWGPWESLGYVKPEDTDRVIKFWTELNDYAVSQRGPSAKTEFEFREK